MKRMSRLEIKGKLIKIAASLLVERMSEFKEDYPKSMPVSSLRKIEKNNEGLRLRAIEVRAIANSV